MVPEMTSRKSPSSSFQELADIAARRCGVYWSDGERRDARLVVIMSVVERYRNVWWLVRSHRKYEGKG
jgi:hypothetical protein